MKFLYYVEAKRKILNYISMSTSWPKVCKQYINESGPLRPPYLRDCGFYERKWWIEFDVI